MKKSINSNVIYCRNEFERNSYLSYIKSPPPGKNYSIQKALDYLGIEADYEIDYESAIEKLIEKWLF